jgi:hypothetical protein
MGASIIWGKNHYVMDAAKAMGLNPVEPQGSGGFMIFNGKDVLFQQVSMLADLCAATIT